jgi:hypothetical protein
VLRVANAQEIEDLMLQLPALVRLQEQRSFHFPERTKDWLGSIEQVFTANRLYQTGLVAALRSGLTAAEHGQLLPGLQFRGQTTRSKVMVAVAAQALQSAAEVVSAILAENRPRFAEAERVAQQIVTAARSRGLIPAREQALTNSQYLRAVRRTLAASADIANAIVALEGLVGPHDALLFLDRALGSDASDRLEVHKWPRT